MAPSPQHDSEPKAPDKSGGAAAQPAADTRNPPAPTPLPVQLPEHVDGLDDGQLRALLDEAITYKCPKDREGKSLLFNELLEEAEQDEEAEGGRGAGGSGWRGARGEARGGRRGRRGERLPHSSSLQDLVAAALADVAPQRRARHAPVSTRTVHGGSLPSGVDRSFLLGEEPMRGGGGGGGGGGADYIATVRCVNPPPLTERRVSVSDAHCSGTEMELLNRRSKIPCTSVTYTSRATLDINSSAGGRAHTTTTCSNQVRTPAPAPSSTAQHLLLRALHKPTDPIDNTPTTHTRKYKKKSATSCDSGTSLHAQNIPAALPARQFPRELPSTHLLHKDSLNCRDSNGACLRPNSYCCNYFKDYHQYRDPFYSEPISSFIPLYTKQSFQEPNFSNTKTADIVHKKTLNKMAKQNVISKSNKYSTVVTADFEADEDLPVQPCTIRNFPKQSFQEPNFSNTKTADKYSQPAKIVHKKTLNKMAKQNVISKSDKVSTVATADFVADEDLPVQPCTIRNFHYREWSRTEANCVYPQYSIYTDCFKKSVPLNSDDAITTIGQPTRSQSCDHSLYDNTFKTDKTAPTNILSGENVKYNCNSNALKQTQALENVKHSNSSKNVQLLTSSPCDLGNDQNVDDVKEVCNDFSKLQQVENIKKQLNSLTTATGVPEVENETEESGTSDDTVEPVQEETILSTVEIIEKRVKRVHFSECVQIKDPIDLTEGSTSPTAAEVQLEDCPVQLDLQIVDNIEDAVKLLNSSKSFQLVKSRSNIPKVPTRLAVEGNSSCRSETSFNITQTTEQVDSGITFGCITTPAVVTSCNTTSSAPAPCASVDSKPRSVIATTINGLASISRNYGAAGTSSADDFKKSLDENGNALQTFNSPLSGSSQQKKPRKKKSSKNETVAMSEQIDGYQGNKELSELLRFIESDAEHGRSHKHKHHHDDDKAGKKRSTERRAKDKADKPQRANSMEELSLTKLEDLTHDKGKADLSLRKHKKERVSDGGDVRKSERRSWGDESRAPYFHTGSEEPAVPPHPPARDKKNKSKQSKAAEWPPVAHDALPADPPLETLEFQTVTKKKRTRKRHSPHEMGRAGVVGVGGSERSADLLYRKLRAPASPDRRRKSAPPSDKSNDSNDDLDSVHSLPAESTAERCAVRPGSASSGGTPQASYADIARTRHNIPDLIESCNFYTDLESPVRIDDKIQRRKEPVCRSDSAPVETRRTPPKTTEESPAGGPTYDTENYPALEARGHRTLPRPKEAKPPPAAAPPKQPERRPKVLAEPTPPEKQAAETTIAVSEEKVDTETQSEPPDVVLAPDRRPPVILLDEASRPREMDGITFGFDINEQLLNGEHRDATPAASPPFPSSDEFPAINEKRSRARCDLVRDALAAGAVPVRAGRVALRFLPPAPLSHAHSAHLHKLANYVGAAWEDIMKCPSGKVRYYSQ